MTMLLQRENAKNEAHLIPLRQNAQKLAFLTEATKSNDGTPPTLITLLPLRSYGICAVLFVAAGCSLLLLIPLRPVL